MISNKYPEKINNDNKVICIATDSEMTLKLRIPKFFSVFGKKIMLNKVPTEERQIQTEVSSIIS